MTAAERDRLASLFGALTCSADAASGFHSEKAIRTAILAARLAGAHGLDASQQSDAFYLALVRFLGCTSFAPEAARFGGGDDISVGAVMGFVDPGEPLHLMGQILKGVGRGAPPARRVKGIVGMLTDPSAPQRHAQTECDVGDALARRIGMPEAIVVALADLFERWDGKGHPRRKQGEQIALLARPSPAPSISSRCGRRRTPTASASSRPPPVRPRDSIGRRSTSCASPAGCMTSAGSPSRT